MLSPFGDLLLHLRRSAFSVAVVLVIAISVAGFVFSRPYFDRSIITLENQMLNHQANRLVEDLSAAKESHEPFRESAVNAAPATPPPAAPDTQNSLKRPGGK